MFAQVRITHLRLLWLRICCVILVRTLALDHRVCVCSTPQVQVSARSNIMGSIDRITETERCYDLHSTAS